jgi:hypothetical protein
MRERTPVTVEQVGYREGGPGWRAGCDACRLACVSKLSGHAKAKLDALDRLDRSCPHAKRHRERGYSARLRLVGYLDGREVGLDLIDGAIYGPFAAVPKTLTVHVEHDGTPVGMLDAADTCDKLRKLGYIPLSRPPAIRRPAVPVIKYRLIEPPEPEPGAAGPGDLFGGFEPPPDMTAIN